jgi:hypothetical protein
MLTQKERMTEIDEIETNYRKNKDLLEDWKTTFRRLEQEVNSLTHSFEQHYEQSAINEQLEESIKEKLKNRQEGIRLTVKSASRLMRRLNPEKPLEEATSEFTFKESLVTVEVKQEESELNADPNLDEILRVESEIQVDGKSETVLESKLEQDVELGQEPEVTLEQEVVETFSNLDTEPEAETQDSQENKDDTNHIVSEVKEVEFTAEETKESEPLVNEESLEVPAMKEVIQSNQKVIQELFTHIEAAEKRFTTFMEKGLAPVMDGLFSGQNYAEDLLDELKAAGLDAIEEVEGWLNIYNVMMAEIKKTFDDFEIDLAIPNKGDQFDEYKHEPIGVVEDPALQDEQVKSVVRFGLTSRRPIFGQESYLIRPAQVIVVKNMNLSLEDVQEGNQE